MVIFLFNVLSSESRESKWTKRKDNSAIPRHLRIWLFHLWFAYFNFQFNRPHSEVLVMSIYTQDEMLLNLCVIWVKAFDTSVSLGDKFLRSFTVLTTFCIALNWQKQDKWTNGWHCSQAWPAGTQFNICWSTNVAAVVQQMLNVQCSMQCWNRPFIMFIVVEWSWTEIETSSIPFNKLLQHRSTLL